MYLNSVDLNSEIKKIEAKLHKKQNIVNISIIVVMCLVCLGLYTVIDHKNNEILNLNSRISELQFETNSEELRIEFISSADSIISASNKNISLAKRNLIACNIWSSAREFNVSPHLVLAVMKIESNFKDTAKSSSNAYGLMQILPSTYKMCRKYLGDPQEYELDMYNAPNQIRYGTMYLRMLYDDCGSWEIAITRYNMGYTNIQNEYSRKVLSNKALFLKNNHKVK